MTFDELKEAKYVESYKCSICGVPVGYSVHPEFAAAVFNSACGCSQMQANYHMLTNDELAAIPAPAPKPPEDCDHEWFDCSNALVEAPTKSCRKCGWTVHGDGPQGVFIKWPWMTHARPQQYASKALDDIAAERRRQIEVEKWTSTHDDTHTNGEMARAAAAYAYEAGRTEYQRETDAGSAPPLWPWSNECWKTTDRRSDLVKAASLAAAEIDRLDRAANTERTTS